MLKQEVDAKPRCRRLVSALLLGGNVTVAKGRTIGGDFAHIPACTSSRQTGCVVAYSSFTSKPPKNSQFGRTTSDAGVSLLAPRTSRPGPVQIMCVNPGRLRRWNRGARAVRPDALLHVRRQLARSDDSLVRLLRRLQRPLQVVRQRELAPDHPHGRHADTRPLLTRFQQPILGLHILDLNIALGNLVHVVTRQAQSYRHP